MVPPGCLSSLTDRIEEMDFHRDATNRHNPLIFR
jgi:hypothetical protein